MPHDAPADGIPRAANVSYSVCKHGTVTFTLLNREGKEFARAFVPYENWVGMIAGVADDLHDMGGPVPLDKPQ